MSAHRLPHLLALLVAGCASAPSVRPQPVPDLAARRLDEARGHLLAPGRGARAAAWAAASDAASLAPGWIAPERLLDDLLVADLRGPEALERRLREVAASPGDPGALYLAGRLEGLDGVARIERAFWSDRGDPWSLHGMAWAEERRGRAQRAVELEGRALVRAREPVERALFARVLARTLLRTGRSIEAMGVLDRELSSGAYTPVDRTALELELAAIELATVAGPAAERGLARAQRLLRERDLGGAEVARLRAAAIPVASGTAGGIEAFALALRARPGAARERAAAELLLERGGSVLALGLLDRAHGGDGGVGDRGPQVRAVRLAAGDLRGAAERWLADLPLVALGADGLPLDADLRSIADHLTSADPGSAVDVGAAGDSLLAAGWFHEARGLAEHLSHLDLEAADALATRAQLGRAVLLGVARALADVDAERSSLDVGALRPEAPGALPELAYLPPVDDLTHLLLAVEQELQAHVDEVAARFGEPARRVDLTASPRLEYGPVAEVVHPGPRFTERDGDAGRGVPGAPVPGLAAELADLGRFGLFGEVVGGGGPDGTVLRLVHEAWLEGEHLGVAFAGSFVLCDGADVPSRPGRRGAGITGAAVHEGYWLDLDLLRRERDRWLVLQREFFDPACPGRAEAALAVRGLPLDCGARPGGGGSRADLVPLLGEADRVRLAILAERRGDADEAWVGLDELLRVAAAHEEGHLCDRTRLLPLHEHGWEVLRLLVRGGFSPAGVAQRLEYRAQLTALCVADDARVPLAEILALAEHRQTAITPHADAYAALLGDLLRELERELEREPSRWFSIDPDRYLVHQLHRLTREQAKALAVRVARGTGLVER